MMTTGNRSVEAVITLPPFHMVGDGFRVHNFFPSSGMTGEKGMSPWFLMDYNYKWNPGPSERQPGLGSLPEWQIRLSRRLIQLN